MVILQEDNRKLRGKMFFIPDGVKRHLKKTLSDYEKKGGDGNADGYDRLSFLCTQENISMEELKRLKNFFDNYKGTEKSETYILNGGRPMADWVNRILKVATDTVRNQKEANELTGLNSKEKKTNNEPRVKDITTDKFQTKNLSNSIHKNKAIKEGEIFVMSERQVLLLS